MILKHIGSLLIAGSIFAAGPWGLASSATADQLNQSTRSTSALTTRGIGLDFRKAFQAEFIGMASVLQHCLAPSEKWNKEVGFAGILEGNIYLSEIERQRINQLALDAIATARGNYTTTSGEVISDLAKFLDNGRSGQIDLQKMVKRFKSAPYILILVPVRSSVDVMQLRMTLYARSEGGTLDCNQSATLNVRLSDNKVVEFAPALGEFVTLDGAYRDALRRAFKFFSKASSISFNTKFDLDGECVLLRRKGERLEEIYFELQSSNLSVLSGDPQLPDVIDPLPSPDSYGDAQESDSSDTGMRFDVRISPASSNNAVTVSFTVRLGNRRKGRYRYQAVVKDYDFRGCKKRQLTASILDKTMRDARRNGLKFNVRATKNRFIVNQDPVQIEVTVDEPLYIYCYYIGQDQTAYVVYPRSQEQARSTWLAGETRRFPDPLNLGLSTFKYKQPEKELWGCFAARERLPGAVEKSWIDAHPFNKGGSGKKKELKKEELEKLVRQLRDIRSVGEHYTWLLGVDGRPSN